MTGLLQDYLTRSAERDGEACALVMGDERMSYDELESETNRWARLMREFGCGDGDRVCVLASKTPRTVAGLLAVLKAGGVYVPVDARARQHASHASSARQSPASSSWTSRRFRSSTG